MVGLYRVEASRSRASGPRAIVEGHGGTLTAAASPLEAWRSGSCFPAGPAAPMPDRVQIRRKISAVLPDREIVHSVYGLGYKYEW